MGKKALITGCEGFIGSYLAEHLIEQGLHVYGLVYQDTGNLDHLKGQIEVINGDMASEATVQSLLAEVKPDYIFHLAAQSMLAESWRDPVKTFTINTLGTIYLLEGVRKAAIDPVILITGSSDEYRGNSATGSPLKEPDELGPNSPYGVSKLAADMLGYAYWKNYGMKIVRIRPFSIIGPRKTGDACSDFAKGIAEIEAGKSDYLSVGNLEAIRDFLDVRDAVRAMLLLAEKGTPGEVYNICSGQGRTMKDLLDMMSGTANKSIGILTDPNRMRSSDKAVLLGDSTKLRELRWIPATPINQTLEEILNYWREKVAK